jgi:hypothetical protein
VTYIIRRQGKEYEFEDDTPVEVAAQEVRRQQGEDINVGTPAITPFGLAPSGEDIADLLAAGAKRLVPETGGGLAELVAGFSERPWRAVTAGVDLPLPSLKSPLTEAIRGFGRGAREYGRQVAEEELETLSPEYMAQQRMRTQLGPIELTGVTPQTVVGTLAESAPAVAATMGPAMVARSAGVAGGLEGLISGAQTLSSIEDAISNYAIENQEEFINSPLGNQALAETNGDYAAAIKLVSQRLAPQMAGGSGAIVGLIGSLGLPGAAGTAAKGLFRNIVKRGLQEGIVEELPQSVVEQLTQNITQAQINPEQQLLAGVPEAAIMGAAAGTLGGAGFGGIESLTQPQQEEQQLAENIEKLRRREEQLYDESGQTIISPTGAIAEPTPAPGAPPSIQQPTQIQPEPIEKETGEAEQPQDINDVAEGLQRDGYTDEQIRNAYAENRLGTLRDDEEPATQEDIDDELEDGEEEFKLTPSVYEGYFEENPVELTKKQISDIQSAVQMVRSSSLPQNVIALSSILEENGLSNIAEEIINEAQSYNDPEAAFALAGAYVRYATEVEESEAAEQPVEEEAEPVSDTAEAAPEPEEPPVKEKEGPTDQELSQEISDLHSRDASDEEYVELASRTDLDTLKRLRDAIPTTDPLRRSYNELIDIKRRPGRKTAEEVEAGKPEPTFVPPRTAQQLTGRKIEPVKAEPIPQEYQNILNQIAGLVQEAELERYYKKDTTPAANKIRQLVNLYGQKTRDRPILGARASINDIIRAAKNLQPTKPGEIAPEDIRGPEREAREIEDREVAAEEVTAVSEEDFLREWQDASDDELKEAILDSIQYPEGVSEERQEAIRDEVSENLNILNREQLLGGLYETYLGLETERAADIKREEAAEKRRRGEVSEEQRQVQAKREEARTQHGETAAKILAKIENTETRTEGYKELEDAPAPVTKIAARLVGASKAARQRKDTALAAIREKYPEGAAPTPEPEAEAPAPVRTLRQSKAMARPSRRGREERVRVPVPENLLEVWNEVKSAFNTEGGPNGYYSPDPDKDFYDSQAHALGEGIHDLDQAYAFAHKGNLMGKNLQPETPQEYLKKVEALGKLGMARVLPGNFELVPMEEAYAISSRIHEEERQEKRKKLEEVFDYEAKPRPSEQEAQKAEASAEQALKIVEDMRGHAKTLGIGIKDLIRTFKDSLDPTRFNIPESVFPSAFVRQFAERNKGLGQVRDLFESFRGITAPEPTVEKKETPISDEGPVGIRKAVKEFIKTNPSVEEFNNWVDKNLGKLTKEQIITLNSMMNLGRPATKKNGIERIKSDYAGRVDETKQEEAASDTVTAPPTDDVTATVERLKSLIGDEVEFLGEVRELVNDPSPFVRQVAEAVTRTAYSSKKEAIAALRDMAGKKKVTEVDKAEKAKNLVRQSLKLAKTKKEDSFDQDEIYARALRDARKWLPRFPEDSEAQALLKEIEDIAASKKLVPESEDDTEARLQAVTGYREKAEEPTVEEVAKAVLTPEQIAAPIKNVDEALAHLRDNYDSKEAFEAAVNKLNFKRKAPYVEVITNLWPEVITKGLNNKTIAQIKAFIIKAREVVDKPSNETNVPEQVKANYKFSADSSEAEVKRAMTFKDYMETQSSISQNDITDADTNEAISNFNSEMAHLENLAADLLLAAQGRVEINVENTNEMLERSSYRAATYLRRLNENDRIEIIDKHEKAYKPGTTGAAFKQYAMNSVIERLAANNDGGPMLMRNGNNIPTPNLEERAVAEAATIAMAIRGHLNKIGLKDVGVRIAKNILTWEGMFEHARVADAYASYFAKTVTLAYSRIDPGMTLEEKIAVATNRINHELFHAINQLGVLNKTEQEAIKRYVHKSGKVDELRNAPAYQGLDELTLEEEAAAELYREFSRNKRVGVPGPVKMALYRISRFIEGLITALNSVGIKIDSDLIVNAEDVFMAIQEGYAARVARNLARGAKTASGRASSASFLFGSMGGLTANGLNLAAADAMEKGGVPMEEIFRETGWFRGRDGSWRYEISDKYAKIDLKKLKAEPTKRKLLPYRVALEDFGRASGLLDAGYYKLWEILDHPQLYKAYPHLKNINVFPSRALSGAFVTGGTIYINPDYTRKEFIYNPNTATLQPGYTVKQVLVHEIQHLIQDHEMLARGGSWNEFMSESDSKTYDALRALMHHFEDIGKKIGPDTMKLFRELVYKKEIAYERYWNLYGELEARRASERMDMTLAERKANFPYTEKEIANSEAISEFFGVAQMADENFPKLDNEFRIEFKWNISEDENYRVSLMHEGKEIGFIRGRVQPNNRAVRIDGSAITEEFQGKIVDGKYQGRRLGIKMYQALAKKVQQYNQGLPPNKRRILVSDVNVSEEAARVYEGKTMNNEFHVLTNPHMEPIIEGEGTRLTFVGGPIYAILPKNTEGKVDWKDVMDRYYPSNTKGADHIGPMLMAPYGRSITDLPMKSSTIIPTKVMNPRTGTITPVNVHRNPTATQVSRMDFSEDSDVRFATDREGNIYVSEQVPLHAYIFTAAGLVDPLNNVVGDIRQPTPQNAGYLIKDKDTGTIRVVGSRTYSGAKATEAQNEADLISQRILDKSMNQGPRPMMMATPNQVRKMMRYLRQQTKAKRAAAKIGALGAPIPTPANVPGSRVLGTNSVDTIKQIINQTPTMNPKQLLKTSKWTRWYFTLNDLPYQNLYLVSRGRTGGNINEFEEFAQKFIHFMNTASQKDRDEFNYYMTHKNAAPLGISNPEIRAAAIEAKDLFMRLGKKFQQTGVLDTAQYSRYMGMYLPRMLMEYVQRELTQQGLKASRQSYTKQRLGDSIGQEIWNASNVVDEAMNVEILRRDVQPIWDTANITQKDEFIEFLRNPKKQLSSVTHNGLRNLAARARSELERVKQKIDASGFIKPKKKNGTFVARYGDNYMQNQFRVALNNKASMGRVYEQDATLGLITDPFFLTYAGIIRQGRDISVIRFMEEIAYMADVSGINNMGWVIPHQFVKYHGRTMTFDALGNELRRLSASRETLENPFLRKVNQELIDEIETIFKNANVKVGVGTSFENIVQFDKDTYRKLPTTYAYGDISGLIVHKAIYNDIVGMAGAASVNQPEIEKLVDKATGRFMRGFKRIVTTLNPPTHVRQIMQNIMTLYLGGVGSSYTLGADTTVWAARALIDSKKNSAMWQLFKELGGIQGTFTEAEIRRTLDALSELKIRELKRKNTSLSGLETAYKEVERIITKAGGKAADLYNFYDTMARYTMFFFHTKHSKMAPGDAIIESFEWIPDYTLVPPAVRLLRNTIFPFITWQYKLFPKMVDLGTRGLAKIRDGFMQINPKILASGVSDITRLSVPIMLYSGLLWSVVALLMGLDEDEAEALRASMSKELRRNVGVIPLPIRDSHGNFVLTDLGVYLPWTPMAQAGRNMFEGGHQDILPNLVMKLPFDLGAGGPFIDFIVAYTTGKDRFTGYDLWPEGASNTQKLAGFLSYAFNYYMPPIMRGMVDPLFQQLDLLAGGYERPQFGSSGFMGRFLDKTFGDGVTTSGKYVEDYSALAARALGFNTWALDPVDQTERNARRMERDVDEMKRQLGYSKAEMNRQIAAIRADSDRSEAEKEQEIQSIREFHERLKDTYREKMKVGQRRVREYRASTEPIRSFILREKGSQFSREITPAEPQPMESR